MTIPRALLKLLARHRLCVHPVYAVEVFHFSRPRGDGTYAEGVRCGHLCNLCLHEVTLPQCPAHRQGDIAHIDSIFQLYVVPKKETQ
jgi:hypothetical protein